MNKVIVIGSPGAGKSVFSKQLHQKTGLPLIHLDMVWHRPDRTHISRDEFDAFLRERFQEKQWIMDGNFSRTREVRLEHADTVFFLDYSVDVCLDGIKRRVGQERDDMPWAAEHLDPSLVQIVRNYPSAERPKILELLHRYSAGRTIFVFRSRDEAARYLAGL